MQPNIGTRQQIDCTSEQQPIHLGSKFTCVSMGQQPTWRTMPFSSQARVSSCFARAVAALTS